MTEGWERRVGVVLVNYHSEHLLEPMVRDLRARGLSARIVDNSGTFPPEIADPDSVIDPGRNLGFGAACNLGIDSLPASVDVICLCNPDVHLTHGALERLQDRVTTGGVSLVSPAILEGGTVRLNGFHYPNLVRETFVAFRNSRSQRRAPGRNSSGTAPRRLRGRGRRFGTGALMVVDRRSFVSVGGFDETYFLYAEDLDLWHRFQRRGLNPVFAPDIIVEHRAHTGSHMAAPSREALRQAGVEVFIERFGPPHAWRAHRLVHKIALARRTADKSAVTELIARLWSGGTPPEHVQWYLRSALGPRTERYEG